MFILAMRPGLSNKTRHSAKDKVQNKEERGKLQFPSPNDQSMRK